MLLVPVVEEGSTVHLHPEPAGPGNEKKPVTLGPKIGKGFFGSVHDVASHGLGGDKDLVVKKFRWDQQAHQKEIDNLRTLGKLKASGEEHGHAFAVMDKVPGVQLEKTTAWKNAAKQGPDALKALGDHASKMVDTEVLHHAHPNNGGLIHKCVFGSETS
jgi:hypothetical protein